MLLVRILQVHLYSSADMTRAGKNPRFISWERSDFYITDIMSIEVHNFPMSMLTSFSVAAEVCELI